MKHLIINHRIERPVWDAYNDYGSYPQTAVENNVTSHSLNTRNMIKKIYTEQEPSDLSIPVFPKFIPPPCKIKLFMIQVRRKLSSSRTLLLYPPPHTHTHLPHPLYCHFYIWNGRLGYLGFRYILYMHIST